MNDTAVCSGYSDCRAGELVSKIGAGGRSVGFGPRDLMGRAGMAAEKPNDSRGKSGSGERKIRMDGAHAMKTDRPAHLPPVPEVAKPEEVAAAAETPVAEVPVEIRMRSLSEIKAEGTLMDRAAVAHRESTASRGRGRRGVPQGGQELEEREEQLHQQASEVAAHLRARLHDLDGRETQLNAMAAQLEADTRLARLTLSGREHELVERKGNAEEARRDALKPRKQGCARFGRKRGLRRRFRKLRTMRCR
ncbi:MAG: hypothetical protein U0894_14665 [Pirellulales bacterium]